ncbi:MAG: hypothetical protein J7L96_04315 [Bacteroidales bacterium]|nr:hypothetical protein [Bacteroidales bacterium]
MNKIKFTLVSDGSSDGALIPHLKWILHKVTSDNCAINGEWADLRRLPNPPKSLSDRIIKAIELYKCDILFVHRDAENIAFDTRHQEIIDALDGIPQKPVVCVVPVRMMEAWLLFDEDSIRRAAGNPNGSDTLNLPRLRDLETTPDPKIRLFEILKIACGLSGRRKRKFDVKSSRTSIAGYIDDFSPLENLSAFKALEEEISNIKEEHFQNY